MQIDFKSNKGEWALARLDDGGERLLLVDGEAGPGWQSLAGWLDGAEEGEPPVRYDLGDDFNIIYSSGTTGTPKGIVQTHRARQHWSYSNALELRMDHESVALATTALYSNGTWFMLLPPTPPMESYQLPHPPVAHVAPH